MIFLLWVACASSDKLNSTSDTSVADTNGQESNASTSNQRYLVTTSILIQRSGHISIWDRETREEVWFFENNAAPAWPEARMAPDGLSLWHNVVDAVDGNPHESRLVQRDGTGDILNQILVDGAHHSFDFVDDDTLVTLVTEIRQHPLYGLVAGDRFVLVDLEGNTETLLSTFDVMEPQPLTDMWNGGNFENSIDWTHSNSISWYPEHDRFLVSIPGINALWLIDGGGTLKTVVLGLDMTAEPYLNGPLYSQSPFDIVTGGSFSLPHGATMDSQGQIWLLSNGMGNETPSFAEGYRIENGELERLVHFGTDPSDAHSPGLGNVVLIESEDNLVINWGIWGVVEERTSGNVPIWRQDAPLGEVYGFSTTAPEIDAFLNAN